MKHARLLLAAAVPLMLVGCSGRKDTGEKLSETFALAKQGKWERVGKQAEELSKTAPNSVAPMLLQALAFEQQGEADKALDLARKCAELAPDDFTAQYTFGRLSAADPIRRSEAFTILENALRLRPGDPDTLVLLCNLGTELGHPRLKAYLEELRRNENYASSPELFYQYGVLKAKEGISSKKAAQAKVFARVCLYNRAGKNSGDPALVLKCARVMDRYQVSEDPKFAVELYQRFLDMPGENKSPEEIQEARQRIRALAPPSKHPAPRRPRQNNRG